MAEDMARFTRATRGSVRDAFASMVAANHLVLTIVPDGTAGTVTANGESDSGQEPPESSLIDGAVEGAAPAGVAAGIDEEVTDVDLDINDATGPAR
jgi:hypothetical protein